MIIQVCRQNYSFGADAGILRNAKWTRVGFRLRKKMARYAVVTKARSESMLVPESWWAQVLGESIGMWSLRSRAIRCLLRQTSYMPGKR